MTWPVTPLVQRYARGYAERNMLSLVRITRPTQVPTLDPATGLATAGADLASVYEGKARVYGVSGPQTMNLGEEVQYFQSTYVSIPVYVDGEATAPRVDDLVEVLEHSDPLMVGKRFRVMDVEIGGAVPSVRRMQVSGVQRFRSWTADAVPGESAETPASGVIPPEWLV